MRSGISAHIWLIALVLAAAVAVSRPATADDRQDCLNGSKEAAAAAIAACTRAIDSGDHDGADLSNLYHHRGFSWSWTDFADRADRALKDYDEAIRLEPNAVGSLLNRSRLYNQRHDYDRAIADVNRAFEGDLSDYGKRSDTTSAAVPIRPRATTTVPLPTIPTASSSMRTTMSRSPIEATPTSPKAIPTVRSPTTTA